MPAEPLTPERIEEILRLLRQFEESGVLTESQVETLVEVHVPALLGEIDRIRDIFTRRTQYDRSEIDRLNAAQGRMKS